MVTQIQAEAKGQKVLRDLKEAEVQAGVMGPAAVKAVEVLAEARGLKAVAVQPAVRDLVAVEAVAVQEVRVA